MDLHHVQVAIPAGTEDDCRKFYGDILGLEEIKKPPAMAARGGLWFKLAHHELHLGVDPDFKPAKKAHPAFVVSNIVELAERLEEQGYAPTWNIELQDYKRFFVFDNCGNRLEFMQQQ